MRKSRLPKSPDLTALSHEHSFGLRQQAANAIEEAQKLLNLGMSDSSDSDGDDSDSDSDGGETQSVQSNHSVCSNEDAEGENENQLTIGKSKEVQEAEKEEIIDEGSIPVFTRHALKSSDNAPIPAELINFFAVDRDELMWQLQHDLLVQWFYVFQTQTVSSDTDREFPSAVASCLYTIVYSSDVILSTEASETLSLLYKEFSSEDSVFWTPSYLELQQGLKYLSQQNSVDVIQHRSSVLVSWCRVINNCFQAIRATQFNKKQQHSALHVSSSAHASSSSSATPAETERAAATLSVREMMLFWRDLMVFSVQPQVAKGGAGQQEKAEGVLLAAQSVMRAAMAKVWRQQQEQQLGYTQSQSQGSQSQGSQSQSQSQGGGVRCTSRQDLAREVHSAILAMYAATAGSLPKDSGRRVKQTSKMAIGAAKKTQKLLDHIELLSVFQNVDTALYIATIDAQQRVFEENRTLNQCMLAVQIVCVENYLLRMFGESDANTTSDEDKFRRFMHDDTLDAATHIVKFQPFAPITVISPSGTLLCLLEDLLSASASQSMVVSAATHYLLQCCSVLNKLSSTLLQRTIKVEEVEKEDSQEETKEKENYSFEANVELIYVLFKHVNLVFNILLESAYAPAINTHHPDPDTDSTLMTSPSKKRKFEEDSVATSPLQLSVAVAKRSILHDESPSCLSPATTATTATTTTASGLSLETAAAVKDACVSFQDAVNEFKSFLRKRMGAMGSTMEISHIIRSINDKWELAKRYYLS